MADEEEGVELRQFRDADGRLWTVPWITMAELIEAQQHGLEAASLRSKPGPLRNSLAMSLAILRLVLDDVNRSGISSTEFVESLVRDDAFVVAGQAAMRAVRETNRSGGA